MTSHKRHAAADKGKHATAPENPPPTQPHFAHITRYWDREHHGFAVKLLPGEYYVTTAGERIAG